MTVKSPDRRALKILFDTYWSSAGWKPDATRFTAPEDFAYAKSNGLMFDATKLNHTEALDWLFHSIRLIDRQTVVGAFLASLSTRRLDWRSALGSFAVFQHMESHAYRGLGSYCNVCGYHPNPGEEDFNILNFERFKWGGVRHDQIVYAAMDLGLFLKEPPLRPTEQDVEIFRNIVLAIRRAPPHTTSAKLEAALAGILRSNKAERTQLISILGFCGILATPDHQGFSDAFIASDQRELPNRHFIDMAYPACWWRAEAGINPSQLEAYFGHIL